MSNNPTLRRAAQFHGHLGPWLVLGLRAGRFGRRRLGATPFNLTALVECPARPPHSCFLDGIQLGAGCTLGKGNIRHVPVPGRCRVTFTRITNKPRVGKRLVLELWPEVWAELANRQNRIPESLARSIFHRRFSSLFCARERTLADSRQAH